MTPFDKLRRRGYNGDPRAANIAEAIEDLWRTHAHAARERRVALVTVHVEQAMRLGWKDGKGLGRPEADE